MSSPRCNDRIRAGSDGMYHSYNILHLDKEGRRARVEHLEEMLEGQVAILASGLLSLPESVQLVTALLKSDLFREDIGSLLCIRQSSQ